MLSHLLYFPQLLIQGSHRLEKYLNIQDCLEKTLKMKFALKSTGKTLKGLEKSLNFTIYRRIQHCLWRLNEYKIVVSLFDAAYAAPNKGTTILQIFSKTNILRKAVQHFRSSISMCKAVFI